METYLLLILAAAALRVVQLRDQRRRIALLAEYLRPYRIEKLMETLSDGYLRALGESDPDRQAQIWALMDVSEAALNDQLGRFAADLAAADPAATRVSRAGWRIPVVERLLPGRSFDLRAAIALHARGVAHVVANAEGLARREKAYILSAEMFLLQHTCHWYCKSRSVASARLLARHRTAYAQVLDAVSADTRRAYRALTA